MTTETPYNRKAEQKRGYRDARQQIELLRSKWPKAFPAKFDAIRPLTGNAKQALVETFGWTPPYARAVLMVWKLRPAYCEAVLRYATRINLDGSESAETVDDIARAAAAKSLEERAAKKAKQKKQEAERERLPEESKANAEAPEPPPTVITESTPEPAAPTELPKTRKLLVAGSAAMQAALKRRLASGAVTTDVLKTVDAPSASRKREHRAR